MQGIRSTLTPDIENDSRWKQRKRFWQRQRQRGGLQRWKGKERTESMSMRKRKWQHKYHNQRQQQCHCRKYKKKIKWIKHQIDIFLIFSWIRLETSWLADENTVCKLYAMALQTQAHHRIRNICVFGPDLRAKINWQRPACYLCYGKYHLRIPIQLDIAASNALISDLQHSVRTFAWLFH